jgi:hypothetical protein
VLRPIKRFVRSSVNFADSVGRRLIPSYRAKRKYASELEFWKGELSHLREWYQGGTIDWWGVPPPSSEKKLTASDIWAVNAVSTLLEIRPS